MRALRTRLCYRIARRRCVVIRSGLPCRVVPTQCIKQTLWFAVQIAPRDVPERPSSGVFGRRGDIVPLHVLEPSESVLRPQNVSPNHRVPVRYVRPYRTALSLRFRCGIKTSFGHAAGLRPAAIYRSCSPATWGRFAPHTWARTTAPACPLFGHLFGETVRFATSSLRSDILRNLPCCFPS